MTAPFLRWVGGKSKLLPTLTKLLPPRVETRRYVEPFVGGGALFFHLQPQEALLSDLNQDLIHTYAAVRDHAKSLVDYLVILNSIHNEALYYEVRDQFNQRVDGNWIMRAARFIYLNRCCFNGVWRVNSKGEYNVPIGKFLGGPNIVNEEVLRAASRTLKNTDLLHGDFESLLNEAWEGDFIYLDPPYVPMSKSADFTSYNKGGFTLDDQKRLAEVFRQLHKRGCMLMLSNSSTDVVRELYADFHITEVTAPRSINSDTSARGHVAEVVVRNYTAEARSNAA